MINVKAKDMKSLMTVMFIMALIIKDSHTEKVFILGEMGKFTTENGRWVSNMVTEFGEELMKILILDNGLMEKPKVMVFILGLIKINLKVNGIKI